MLFVGWMLVTGCGPAAPQSPDCDWDRETFHWKVSPMLQRDCVRWMPTSWCRTECVAVVDPYAGLQAPDTDADP